MKACSFALRRVGGLLLLTLAMAASSCTHAVHRSHGVSSNPVPTLRPERERQVTLVILGDSIAQGQGAGDPRRSFAFDLYRHLAARYPQVQTVDRAIGGARIADVERLELGSLPAGADAVVIEAGANDVVRGASPGAVRRDGRRLFEALRRALPRTPVIVCGIPDLSISPIFEGNAKHAIRRLSRDDDEALRAEAARHRLAFVDVYALAQRARAHTDAFLGADDFHPSDRGHAAIAALTEPALDRILNRQ